MLLPQTLDARDWVLLEADQSYGDIDKVRAPLPFAMQYQLVDGTTDSTEGLRAVGMCTGSAKGLKGCTHTALQSFARGLEEMTTHDLIQASTCVYALNILT